MRRRTESVEADVERSRRMNEFVGEDPKPRKKRTARSAAGMRRAMEEAKQMLDAGAAWDGATASMLVGLYALLHEKVYGVAPEELADAWLAAVSAAGRLVREFDGARPVAEFLRFVWKNEREQEAKAKGTGHVRRRIGWRLQFVSRALLVDFKRAILATRKT